MKAKEFSLSYPERPWILRDGLWTFQWVRHICERLSLGRPWALCWCRVIGVGRMGPVGCGRWQWLRRGGARSRRRTPPACSSRSSYAPSCPECGLHQQRRMWRCSYRQVGCDSLLVSLSIFLHALELLVQIPCQYRVRQHSFLFVVYFN